MRAAFLNELDSCAAMYDLDMRQFIGGVSLDPRMGPTYNNSSFCYVDYNSIWRDLITVKQSKVVGLYILVMKS